MTDFDRKVTVQVHDGFPNGSDIAEVEEFIRKQRVPGELVITYSGNGGRTSITFHGKPVSHRGAVKEV